MILQARNLLDRARGSLFFVPAFYVLAAVVVTLVVVRLDRRLFDAVDGPPLLLSATVASARQTLATIAGATITVAGIVFSVTVVSVQLASSQFSPRVLRWFLRDRFLQHVIGVVMVTFTYCLLALTSIRSTPGASEEPQASVRVTLGVTLAVVAVIAILAFIDHSARSMQVTILVERVARETRQRIDALFPPPHERRRAALPQRPPPEGESRAVRAEKDGWIQAVDTDAWLRLLPPGGTAALHFRVGDFVVEGSRLASVRPADVSLDVDLDDLVAMGSSRSMQQDVAFGIRQLVDIGLRALSPGVNDPTTAYEVLTSLGAVLNDLLVRAVPGRVVTGDDDRALYFERHLSHEAYVRRAFDQLRVAAASQPAVLLALIGVLETLRDRLVEADLGERAAALEEQARLVVRGLDDAPFLEEDADRVRRRAVECGLVEAPADPNRDSRMEPTDQSSRR